MAELDTDTATPEAAARPVKHQSRWRRFLLRSAVGLVIFALLGFFAAPALLKSVLTTQLAAHLHRDVSIQNVALNPFALTAKIDGLSIKAPSGKEALGFEEFFVDFSVLSLVQLAPVVDEFRLHGLRVAVARLEDGQYDVSDLLDEWIKPANPETETSPPRFSVNNIQLLDASLTLDDQPVGKVHTVSAINLRLPFISSMAHKVDVYVTPHFSAKIDDAPLLLEGSSKPFAEGRESEIRLDLDQFNLAALQPYVPASLPLKLLSATVDSELTLIFKELADQSASLTLLGALHLSDFKLADGAGEHLLGWKKLDVDIAHADLLKRKIAVKGITLDGLDASLSVNRQGELNVLRLAEKLSAAPVNAPAQASDNAESKPQSKAEVKATEGELEWTLDEFRLSNGLVHWKDESNLVPVQGEVRKLNVQVGKIDSKLATPIDIAEASYQLDLGEHLRVDRALFKDIKLDLHGHRVDVGEVINAGTRAQLRRDPAGAIEWVSSPLLKTVRKTGKELSDERAWVGRVGKLAIDDLSLRIEDQSTSPVAVQVIDGFHLSAENLSNEANQSGKIALKSRINQKGSLKLDGSVQASPLKMNLQVETQRISMLPIQPYFAQHLNIALTRGLLSSKGEVTAEMGKQGLSAAYQGSLTVGDLVTVDKENNSDFLKWRSLYFGGVDFRLQPMTLTVGEIALTDFFSRLILDETGQLNVAGLIKKPAQAVDQTPAMAQASPVVHQPAEKSTEQAAVAKIAPEKAALPPIKIAKITLQNGTVNFSDWFVKPNYTVKVAKLGGRVTGLSTASDAIADLELRGTYATSAPVQIVAKLNPLATTPFLDLKAEISGVDMVGFSPYSGKYAGYNIEKGKLSLNVNYKLENNQLAAENKLFIDQFTFGERVESPDATQLPVNLAISLLKNNRGEIDLDLPISGSLDDPQFSIGGLIIKVIVNLFVKVVTSPFALLGSMVGGGEELSYVEFATGRGNIDVAAGKKLESLAKALNDRAALKLEITGRADPEVDKEGLKRAAMARAATREKLKEIQKKQEGASLDETELTPEDYPVYLKRAYQEAKFPKPRNLVGLQKDIPLEEMEKLMLSNLPATADDVRALAISRAEAVQLWLIEQGKVPAERIFLLPPKVDTDAKGKSSRADFSLR